jgi:DNA-binding NarL/FixJ family response regulator
MGHFSGRSPTLLGFRFGGCPESEWRRRTDAAERSVLRLVALGLDNRAIARQPCKSEKTVRNQVSSIFAKIGVRTRSAAIVHGRDATPRWKED